MLPSHVYLVYVKGDKSHRVFTDWILASSWSKIVDGVIIPYVIERPKEGNFSDE